MSSAEHIVLVTGANQGIGYQTALQLSKHANVHVLIGARDLAKGEEAAKTILALSPEGVVSPLLIDITSDDSVAAAVREVESKFGRLDVLVNNAGTYHEFDPTFNTRERFRRTYEVNVFGTAATSEAFLPLLEKSSFPRIVNVTSTLGSINIQLTPNAGLPIEQQMAYNTSKSAVNSITVHFSLKLKQKPSRVVAICPGFTATALNGFAAGAQDAAIGAAGIVRVALEPADGKFKTGEFWNEKGEKVQW